MASSAVEVIDLTETAEKTVTISQPTPEPQHHLSRQERRRLAALNRQASPSARSPITISDDETKVQPTNSSQKRKRKKKKDHKEDLEDGEIDTSEHDQTRSGMKGIAIRTVSKTNDRQLGERVGSNFKKNYFEKGAKNCDRRSPSPQLFIIDENPDETLVRPVADEGKASKQVKGATELRDFGLLLPNHVHLESLSAGVHIEAPATSETEDDDFIYFVDEDRIVSAYYCFSDLMYSNLILPANLSLL